ncbi:hypothetical protein [Kordiimonas sp. SCSIO 12610]|uniref:hypothetical protein n=1 Tax=Kordiimonas sp. SCSIO 12610 TaxID=2829597 RepID=UPI00210A3A1B|nr:hypothetical protein [Kordiimonas sp. SCSIO 12610]UTW54117.1 hypothetical protein KFF44_09770 [Kordiimonas sp. SCSIO 12610]
MAEDAEVEEKSGGGGKILLIVGLLAGLAIGGGAVFFLLPQEGGEEVVEEPEEKAPIELTSITFEKMPVPIYRRHNGQARFIGNFFIDLDVNVEGDDNAVTVRRSMTRLKHAFLSEISTGRLMRKDSPTELDVDRAGKVLADAANKVLGEGTVHSVSIITAVRTAN